MFFIEALKEKCNKTNGQIRHTLEPNLAIGVEFGSSKSRRKKVFINPINK